MGCIFVINIHNNMKNSFLLVLLLLVGGAVSAQRYHLDTVMRPFIYVDIQSRLDSGKLVDIRGNWGMEYNVIYNGQWVRFNSSCDLLQYNYIEGGADIYGIQVWVHGIFQHESQLRDLVEWVYLYEATPDTFQEMAVAPINLRDTFSTHSWPETYDDTNALAEGYMTEVPCNPPYNIVYENSFEGHWCYFDKPVHVEDSFYVGFSEYGCIRECMQYYEPGGILYPWTEYLCFHGIHDSESEYCRFPNIKKKFRWMNTFLPGQSPGPVGEWLPAESQHYYLVFPILREVDTVWDELSECGPVELIYISSSRGDTTELRWTREMGRGEWQLSYGRVGTEPDSGRIVTCYNNSWKYVDTLHRRDSMVAYVRVVCRDCDTLRYSDWSRGVTWGGERTGIDGAGDGNGVRVMPNPAREEVTVESECRMDGIDVYGSDGKRYLTVQGQPHKAGFTVRGWAAGIYVLVVHTEAGDVVKRLSVE